LIEHRKPGVNFADLDEVRDLYLMRWFDE
jgi:hypothetical protein